MPNTNLIYRVIKEYHSLINRGNLATIPAYWRTRLRRTGYRVIAILRDDKITTRLRDATRLETMDGDNARVQSLDRVNCANHGSAIASVIFCRGAREVRVHKVLLSIEAD